MRTLIIAMGLAAFASGPVIAQVTTGSASTGAATTSGTSNNTISGTSAQSNVVGPSNSTSTPTTTTGSGTATTGGSGGISNVVTDPSLVANDAPRFGPGSTFATDSGNSALGTSPGQTSAGTAAGNSSAGFANDSARLGVTGPGNVATVVPDNVSVIGGSTGGGSGGVIAIPSGNQQQQVTIQGQARTPLFDQAAREGRAKDAARRARGDEPRVYGIAPNTERDLTWQMPDDRIIRY